MGTGRQITLNAASRISTTKAHHVKSTRPYQISIQMLNVCGLKRKLLDIQEFKNTLLKCDISLLCETKLDNADNELIQETINKLKLKAFFKNRRIVSAWRSGGLCIIYNENIEKYLTYVESKCNPVQWLKIDKSFLGTDKDVLIGNTYIPPVGTRYESVTPFLDLLEPIGTML